MTEIGLVHAATLEKMSSSRDDGRTPGQPVRGQALSPRAGTRQTGWGPLLAAGPPPPPHPPAPGQKLHWAGPRPHCLAELGGVCFLSPSVRRSLLLLATCLLWLLLCGRALRSPGVRARPPPRPPPHGKPEAGCPPRRHLPPRAFGGDRDGRLVPLKSRDERVRRGFMSKPT